MDSINNCIKESEAIKTGSTRAELLKLYMISGGLSTRTSGTFLYRKNPHIKVEVEFYVISNDEKILTLNPDDKIRSITLPTLQTSIVSD
jgi:hypothetical protein